MQQITEGKALFQAPVQKVVTKDLEVFYNTNMEYNRSLSIDLLQTLGKEKMQIALPLAGTGVRAIRFLKELPKKQIKKIYINDKSKKALTLIKKNLKLNSIKSKFEVHNEDAGLFLLKGKGYDYIDVDPFGSPNKFLNASIERLARGGILAVTATDTGALCGTYRSTCQWKYWATPLHTIQMHEVGLRILIRKVQLMGLQHEKALLPIVSYSKDHYMRVFFSCEKGKTKCTEIFKQHQKYKDAGPMWVGKLKDQTIINKLSLTDQFTTLLKEEIDILGFYDIPNIHKKEKIKDQKKMETIFEQIKKKGYKVSRTQFSKQGIKSDISYTELLKILKK